MRPPKNAQNKTAEFKISFRESQENNTMESRNYTVKINIVEVEPPKGSGIDVEALRR